MTLKSFFAALMLAAASVGSHAVSVELDPIGSLQVGQSFGLQLRVDAPFAGLDADEALLAFGFHLDFDSSLLQFKSFTPAAGWDDDSGRLGAGIFSASNFPGVFNAGQSSLVLATLHFDVLRAGSTGVSLLTDAGDFNQGLTYLFADPIALTATENLTLAPVPVPVPEPGTFLLMAGGLAGLAVWRRRNISRCQGLVT